MCAEREMNSRDKDQTAPHQPLLSSLVVRPTDTGGGGAGGDYEPGEVRRDPPPYSRSNRYDGHGYRMRAGSVSPVRRRDSNHRFSPGFEPSRSRGLGNGKEPGRYRDYSLPYARGRDGSRLHGRGYEESARGPGPFRVEGLPRNNPNVRPREGDWICSDPSCKNLNFARRDHCNNCNRPRYGRGYPGPPLPPRQPLDHSPGIMTMNGGYRSPPRAWPPRDAPRDFRAAAGVRQDYPEDDPHPRDRYNRFDNRPPLVPDWSHRDRDHRARDNTTNNNNYFNERRGYIGNGRRVLSPPPPAPPVPPPRGGWGSDSHIRDRSRSPLRGGPLLQPKGYQRDNIYVNNHRRRDDHRRGGVGRDAF